MRHADNRFFFFGIQFVVARQHVNNYDNIIHEELMCFMCTIVPIKCKLGALVYSTTDEKPTYLRDSNVGIPTLCDKFYIWVHVTERTLNDEKKRRTQKKNYLTVTFYTLCARTKWCYFIGRRKRCFDAVTLNNIQRFECEPFVWIKLN